MKLAQKIVSQDAETAGVKQHHLKPKDRQRQNPKIQIPHVDEGRSPVVKVRLKLLQEFPAFVHRLVAVAALCCCERLIGGLGK
jgi:hypothetical protein